MPSGSNHCIRTMSERNEHHYLPVNDRATGWGFYLTTAGRVLEPVATDMPYGVHPVMYLFDQSPAPEDVILTASPWDRGRVLPEFQVVLFTESQGVFESKETGVVEFEGPTLLFLFPGVWHRYRPVGSGKRWLTARWLGFNGDLAYRLMARHSISPETACGPAARPRRLAAAFDRMVDRVAGNPGADQVLLSMHAMDLLADCIESTKDGAGVRSADGLHVGEGADPLVSRMLDLIWTGSHRGMTVDQLCDSLGTNRRTVERRFRDVRGHSPLAEINLCRCHRARHFLETTDLPIKNVCWLAGFNNTEQMRSNFQQVMGMSAEHYRRAHRLERK
jgi:AraC-like DNA-binding protein